MPYLSALRRAVSRGARVLLVYLLLATTLALAPWAGWSPGATGPAAAWADDGDGDGDDGGGDDGGGDGAGSAGTGSGSSGSTGSTGTDGSGDAGGGTGGGGGGAIGTVAPPPPRLAVVRVRSGNAVRAEVLGIDLNRNQISEVLARGFSVIGSAPLRQSNISYTRFAVPANLTETQAQALLNAEVANNRFDLNHVYRLSQGACTGRRCADRELVAWPVDQSARCRIQLRVGMIDTGVSAERAGVPAARLTQRSFHGGRGVSNTDHGSAVAALLAGQGHGGLGLLPHSQLFAADVFQPLSDGTLVGSASAMAEAVDWLIARGARVINISVTGPDNRLLQRSLETAARKGVVVVAAAGNDGPRAQPAFPAAYPQTIAVTAVDVRRRLYARASRGSHIALAAPGVAVFAPTSGQGSFHTGTSFAAPFVTASVAVLLARNANTAANVGKALESSVVDLGAKGRDPLFGWGLLRAPALCS